MEKEIEPSVIKSTQNSLGKYVKKPPLSEKLLKKPPFRFLHDIITSVLKSTSFFEGLFDETELVSENVKDRDSKIVFLTKIICVLGETTGKSLSAKPSKIVAGQEPEKTNELLQCLAFALDNKLNSQEAVTKYRENSTKEDKGDKKTNKGTESNKPVKKVVDDKKLVSRSSEKLTTKRKESEQRSKQSEKNTVNSKTSTKTKETNVRSKKESPPKQSTKKTKPENVNKHVEKPQESTKVSLENHVENETEGDSNKVMNNSGNKVTVTAQKSDFEDAEINNSELKQNLTKAFTKPSEKTIENDERPLHTLDLTTEDPKQDAIENEMHNVQNENKIENVQEEVPELNIKPSETGKTYNDSFQDRSSDTALDNGSGDAPPRVTENVNVLRPPSVRPSSSRPGAPRPRDKLDSVIPGNENIVTGKVNIIIEDALNDEEEDTSIVIVDKKLEDNQDGLPHGSSSNHGRLVQQILDSTKEFSQLSGKTEIEWQFDAVKAKEASKQEIELIKFNIQALSRVANPLGKLLDHIQEDVEVMRQELQQWTKSYEQASKELLGQKTANEESLFPLHAKIKQLNADIEEKHDKLNDLKVITLRNAARINKLLVSGNVQ